MHQVYIICNYIIHEYYSCLQKHRVKCERSSRVLFLDWNQWKRFLFDCKLLHVICFSWIYNIIVLVFFFRKSLLYPCVGFRYLLYGTFNGISFSSLYRGITHFFISNLHKEVKLISMSVKLHSTQEHFDGV